MIKSQKRLNNEMKELLKYLDRFFLLLKTMKIKKITSRIN